MNADSVNCVCKVLVICILIISSIFDIKRKAVPMWLLGTGVIVSACGCLVMITIGDKSIYQSLIMIIPAAAIFVMNILKKKAIGVGDGYMLIIMSGLMSLKCYEISIAMAVIFSFLVSAYLICFKKIGKKNVIPFIPFLAAGSFVGIIAV